MTVSPPWFYKVFTVFFKDLVSFQTFYTFLKKSCLLWMESQYYCVYKLNNTKLWRKKPKLNEIHSYSQKLDNSVCARRTAYFLYLWPTTVINMFYSINFVTLRDSRILSAIIRNEIYKKLTFSILIILLGKYN